jgi:hypothetical protein
MSGDFKTLTQNETNESLKTKLEEVAFVDPLGDEARKTKRNLLTLCVVVIVVALYRLQFKTVLNFSVPEGAVPTEAIQGFACVMLLYFLVKYFFEVRRDYKGWKHKTRVVEMTPFLPLIRIYSDAQAAADTRLARLEAALRTDPKGQPTHFAEALNFVQTAGKEMYHMNQSFAPLLASWKNALERMEAPSKRLDRETQWAFWIIDVLIPGIMSFVVLWRSRHNLGPVLHALWTWLGF